MKFGIMENKDGCFCANCDKFVSKDGVYTENFCSKCGIPIKKEGADIFEQRLRDMKKEIL